MAGGAPKHESCKWLFLNDSKLKMEERAACCRLFVYCYNNTGWLGVMPLSLPFLPLSQFGTNDRSKPEITSTTATVAMPPMEDEKDEGKFSTPSSSPAKSIEVSEEGTGTPSSTPSPVKAMEVSDDKTSSPSPAKSMEVYQELSVYAKDAFNSIHLRNDENGNENDDDGGADAVNENAKGEEKKTDGEDSSAHMYPSREFNATMHIANHLIAEIHDYKYRQTDKQQGDGSGTFSSLFVDENVLKSACYGEICLNTMLQVVGGPNGNQLPSLTINQLLDLIVWIEFFREVLREANPDIKARSVTLQRVYLDEKPDLFPDDDDHKDGITFAAGLIDMLVWIHNMSWEVHRLAQDEFLLRTKRTTDQWLSQLYTKQYAVWQTKEGRLITNLSEDVFAMVSLQIKTMQERLTDSAPDALIIGVCLTFSRLREQQIQSRDTFLKDFETCIAAANDFQRMSEMVDDICHGHLNQLPKASEELLEGCRADLVSTFMQDAVYSAQKASIFIFEPIRQSIFMNMFSTDWLDKMAKNEFTLRLTNTLQDFIGDLVLFLDDYLLRKLLNALVPATINFYVERLVNIADSHPRGGGVMRVTKAYFKDVPQVTKRFDDDIQILVEFFNSITATVPGMPKEYATKDLNLLTAVNELMSIASGHSNAEVNDFMVVVHKSVRDVSVTRSFVGDLWLLTRPNERKKMKRRVLKQRNMLESSASNDNDLMDTTQRSKMEYGTRERVQDLELGLVLKETYIKRKEERRKRRLRRLRGNCKNPQVHPQAVQQ